MSLFSRLYIKFFIGSGFPYGKYLKNKGVLHSQGENCYIARSANIPDPYLTSIGDNVWITGGCQILCHDASVIMLNIMRKGHLDRVGPIVIGSNSFLGNNVIVLSDTRIGPNAIVGAGSVVAKDVPENSVFAGNPARFVCPFDEYVERIESSTREYPWHDLLKRQDRHVFDAELEVRLRQERVKYFFREPSSGEK